MTLSFSTHMPDGTPNMFVEKILHPYSEPIRKKHPDLIPKIHTFRLGDRWRHLMPIHMVTGNRTANRVQFNENVPELGFCKSTQECTIQVHPDGDILITIDDRILTQKETMLFIANDGFDKPKHFLQWFGHPHEIVEHTGQIIHWTDFKY